MKRKYIIYLVCLIILSLTSSAYSARLTLDWSRQTVLSAIRAASYNPVTNHILVTETTYVSIIDGETGAWLGRLNNGTTNPTNLFAVAVTEDGVIFAADAGANQLIRWTSESDTSPVAIAYGGQLAWPPRGMKAFSLGTNTAMLYITGGGDNSRIDIAIVADNRFTIVDTIPAPAAKTDVAVPYAGADIVYGIEPWGTPDKGVRKFKKIYGSWSEDPEFSFNTASWNNVFVGDIDPHPDYNVLYVLSYATTLQDTTVNNVLGAVDATTGADIARLTLPHEITFYGGVKVDRSTHKIYWAARMSGDTVCWGRITYTPSPKVSPTYWMMGVGQSKEFNVAYGTPPYTWSVSTPGIISLSTTEGPTVVVTGIAPGTVDLIVTDSASETATATVIVVATEAPVIPDHTIRYNIYRRELFE